MARVVSNMMTCLCVCLCLYGCGHIKYVPVVEYRERVQTDTVEKWCVDSIYTAHWYIEKGDTVWKIDTIYQYKILREVETAYQYVRDSIPYEVEVVREVRKRNGYDKFVSWGFWLLFALLILRVAWWAVKKYYLRV